MSISMNIQPTSANNSIELNGDNIEKNKKTNENSIESSGSSTSTQCSDAIDRLNSRFDNYNPISNPKTSFEPNEIINACFDEMKSIERSLERDLRELQIISSMKKCIDSEYKIIPFGSSHWYLGGRETNFNVLQPIGKRMI